MTLVGYLWRIASISFVFINSHLPCLSGMIRHCVTDIFKPKVITLLFLILDNDSIIFFVYSY